MNLFEVLKQFKDIHSDPAYRERSKQEILSHVPVEHWNPRRVVFAMFETGIAVALSVFFIIAVAGKLPNSSYVAPSQLSAMNPQTLRAEAQAVDIQIKLAQVAYTFETSTPATAPRISIIHVLHIAPTNLPAETTSSAASTISTSSISLDEALQKLSQ